MLSKLQLWIVIDLDVTLITAHSAKEGASATFKKGYGFHPLAVWCANTHECLAMLLRTGSAGSNTITDHVQVLTEAIAQILDDFRAKIWIRIDGAGATHDLVEHMQALNTTRRTVRFTVGWKITEVDESAIAKLPETAWQAAVRQDGEVHEDARVAELTGLDERAAAWGVRLLVRRVRPSARDARQLTDLEKKTGWKYAIIATSLRPRACAASPAVTTCSSWMPSTATTPKSKTGCAPTRRWGCGTCAPRRGTSTSAECSRPTSPPTWTRLLGLHDDAELARAEPQTLRYCLWHLPARLVSHARRRILKISTTWPWKNAFLTCWQRLCALPAPG